MHRRTSSDLTSWLDAGTPQKQLELYGVIAAVAFVGLYVLLLKIEPSSHSSPACLATRISDRASIRTARPPQPRFGAFPRAAEHGPGNSEADSDRGHLSSTWRGLRDADRLGVRPNRATLRKANGTKRSASPSTGDRFIREQLGYRERRSGAKLRLASWQKRFTVA
jgi:hypothetical protein